MTQTFSPQTWANSLLASLGNATPNQKTTQFVMGWEQEEGGGIANACQFNALNTTLPYNGSVQCSSVSGIPVQSYPDFNSGVRANALTLSGGNYSSLLQALQSNDTNALGMNGNSPSLGVQQNLSTWVSGKSSPIQTGYINNIEKLAGGSNASGGECVNTSDICLCCGSKGSVAYQNCLAQVAIGINPACAQASYNAQSPVNNLQGIGGQIQNALLGPIEQALPGYLMKAGLFAFALLLVVFGFVILRG